MAPRRQFYEPIVQAPGTEPPMVELPPLRGVPVEAPGMYLFAPDVSAMLRRMAETYQEHGERAALYLAADLLDEAVGGIPPEPGPEPVEPPEPPVSELQPEPMADPIPFGPVARVEVFPNEDGTYWYARAVDDGGFIIDSEPTIENIRREAAETLAQARWPGVPLFEVPDAMGDSFWDEQHSLVAWNGRRRPSPRRLWVGAR